MSATYALTLASTKMLFRNWSSLIFTFVLPLLILLAVGFAPLGGPPHIAIGVVASPANPAAASIKADLQASRVLAVRPGQLEALQAELVGGKLAAVIQLPDAPVAGAPAPVRVYASSAQASQAEIATALLWQAIDRNGLRTAAAGVTVQQQVVASQEVRYVNFLLPGIIGLAIMQMCIFSVAPTFVFYRERGILKRLLSTPMKPYQFIVSNSAARLVVATVQALAFIAIGTWVFHSSPNGSYAALALCILMGAVMFLGLGFTVAGIASSVEQAPVLANLVTFPMILLGGTFFSISSMPRWIQNIANNLPLAHFSGALRAVMNEHADLVTVQPHLIGIVGWALVFITIAVYTFRMRFARAA